MCPYVRVYVTGPDDMATALYCAFMEPLYKVTSESLCFVTTTVRSFLTIV